jgi:hypothetical protein
MTTGTKPKMKSELRRQPSFSVAETRSGINFGFNTMNDQDKTYRIRPLEWRDGGDAESEGVRTELRETDFPIGWLYFVVKRWDDDQWYWGEVYNLGAERNRFQMKYPCDSLEDGKENAWQDWLSRITPALIEVND